MGRSVHVRSKKYKHWKGTFRCRPFRRPPRWMLRLWIRWFAEEYLTVYELENPRYAVKVKSGR